MRAPVPISCPFPRALPHLLGACTQGDSTVVDSIYNARILKLVSVVNVVAIDMGGGS